MHLWKGGNICEIMREVRYIQRKITTSKKQRTAEDISKTFAKLMMQGKVSVALKYLDNESSSVMTCTDSVLKELREKHPPEAPIKEGNLLFGPINLIRECFFDEIDETSIFNSALRTKGSAGPSGMDSELYCRILCSKCFGSSCKSLREEIATFTKNIATKSYHPDLLQAYVSSRLIALDKNPGVRPIGVVEVLRRIVGKTISHHCQNEIKEAAGPLQTCAGHGAGAEAAIHAMRTIYQQEATDAVLLIDAKNAFNCLNRSVALHNIQIICPILAMYLINTYRRPATLFIYGGETILSREGTTQGDPLAMPWYSLSTANIINVLREIEPSIKQVWLADDATAAGDLFSLRNWYKYLEEIGDLYGYYVNKSKCWLIVKSEQMAEKAKQIFGEYVKITTHGKRHLGAVLGSENYKREYCENLVDTWLNELSNLCTIADTQPQAAYAAYTKGYRSKFTYFLRTIEGFEEFLVPVDNLINDKFLPIRFGNNYSVISKHRDLLALNTSQGGMGIPILSNEAKPHIDTVINQFSILEQMESHGCTFKQIKSQVLNKKLLTKKQKCDSIHANLPESLKPVVEQASDKGASSWLNTIPLEEQNLDLNKEEFKHAVRLR